MPRIHQFLKHSFMIDNFLERCTCIWRKKSKFHKDPTKSKYDSLKTVCLFLESYKRYRLFTGYMEHVHRADEDHALLVNIADHSHSLTHGSAWMSADPKLVEHAIREEEKKAKEMEKKLEGYLVETGIEGQVIITKGDPGPTLIKLADEFNAAYIVTGTRGHGKIRRTILGSVSDYVMHHSHVPVLIYRS